MKSDKWREERKRRVEREREREEQQRCGFTINMLSTSCDAIKQSKHFHRPPIFRANGRIERRRILGREGTRRDEGTGYL